MHHREIKTKKLTWVNVTKPTPEALAYLKKRYRFHPLDLEDCVSPAQRPKLDVYPRYLFLVLIFPVYDRATGEIVAREVNFFIMKNTVVTVHRSDLFPFMECFEQMRMHDDVRQRVMANPATLLYELLNRLLMHTFPMLDHMALDINRSEQEIFNGNGRRVIREILAIKRNIVNFRRIMQAHKGTIRRLRDKGAKILKGEVVDVYFENLVEHTKDIWDTLENQKDTIDALQESNESMITFQLNDIMKLLTIISVGMLPAGLVANLFSTDAVFTPIIGLPGDFWILLGLMGLVALGMMTFFRKKRWM